MTETEAGRSPAAALLDRIGNHRVAPERPSLEETTHAQLKAIPAWSAHRSDLA
jgi:hypothetical protein